MAAPIHSRRPNPITTSSSSSGPDRNPYISSPLASPTVYTASSSPNTNPFRKNDTPPQNTNPFRTPKQSLTTTDFSATFSPISPIEAQPAIMSEPRKSVDLRTIDGKPYPGTEDKPRKVKVAQDMYAGDMPPSYDGSDYKPSAEKGEKSEKSEKSKKDHKHTDSCQKCGGHKKGPSVATSPPLPPPQNIDCNQCGGKRSTPPSSYPGANTAPVRVQPFYPPIQSAEAGPSNAPRTKHHCTKCGRRKRPESISTSGSNTPQRVPNHRSIPSIQTNGVPIMNIEPPTATNERAPTFPATSPMGAPLTKNRRVDSLPQEGQTQQGKQKSHSRSNSISRLFRSLSGRKKSVDVSPAPAMPTGESSRGNRRSSSHTRLGDNKPSRSPSPFSFVDKPQEDQAFEMNDIRQSKLPERRDSWEKSDETTTFLGPSDSTRRPRLGRSQSTTAAKYPENKPVDDVYLSLPPDQRPGITRFKSLRGVGTTVSNGLSRSASQISRSSSLRRLGSVKKVPDLWYREVDGPGAEFNNYGY